jgi:glutathione synthase/RimK-type ligase-like ATP-grasp enzyme
MLSTAVRQRVGNHSLPEPSLLPFGAARLATTLARGQSVKREQIELVRRVLNDASDAAALMDLSALCRLAGEFERAQQCQEQALLLTQMYRLPPAPGVETSVRLLMFAAPGDFMTNTPIEFLLEGTPVSLDTVYLKPGQQIPTDLPEHDLVLVGIAEAPETRAMLLSLGTMLATWPKPVLNMPSRILDLARERLFDVLAHVDGVTMPTTVWVSRETLRQVVVGTVQLAALARDLRFPIIARPVRSHAGEGLMKLNDEGELFAYLLQAEADEFYVARYVDYSSSDKQFRKYRVCFIGGTPYLCHMAISSEWMVHYLNAGMQTDPLKRAEEAANMQLFDTTFARRHAAALTGIAEALDLEYFAIDCAEMPDGRLLVFEAGTAMIVHRMDPPELYPYKQAQMDRICTSFVAFLQDRSNT